MRNSRNVVGGALAVLLLSHLCGCGAVLRVASLAGKGAKIGAVATKTAATAAKTAVVVEGARAVEGVAQAARLSEGGAQVAVGGARAVQGGVRVAQVSRLASQGSSTPAPWGGQRLGPDEWRLEDGGRLRVTRKGKEVQVRVDGSARLADVQVWVPASKGGPPSSAAQMSAPGGHWTSLKRLQPDRFAGPGAGPLRVVATDGAAFDLKAP